jgi:O-antigen/teichoic acid export membrane protein
MHGMVRTSLLLPVAAKAWTSMLMLAAVPVYVRFLGVDAFGVVGLFTTAAAVLAVFDLGMPAWLIREFAGSPAPAERRRLSSLAHSMDWLAVSALLLITLTGAAFVYYHPPVMQEKTQIAAMVLGVVALGVQWPGNLYAAMLAGQQRHATAALIAAACSTVRVALTLGGLWISPSLLTFFSAQAVMSAVQTLALRWQATRPILLPGPRTRPNIGWLAQARGFAPAMTLMGVLSLVLSQADKVLVGQWLSLAEFGVYMIGWTVAGGLSALTVAPMSSIALAWLSAGPTRRNEDATWQVYQQLTAWMVALLVPPTVVLSLMPEMALILWGIPGDIASQVARLLPWLLAGTALNGLMTIPYMLQIAHGWVQLPLKVNLLALCALLPVLAWATSEHGIEGAAIGWLVTNGVFVLVWPWLMHRRLLRGFLVRWLIWSVLFPISLSTVVVWGLLCLLPITTQASTGWQVGTILGAWIAGVLTTIQASPGGIRLLFTSRPVPEVHT